MTENEVKKVEEITKVCDGIEQLLLIMRENNVQNESSGRIYDDLEYYRDDLKEDIKEYKTPLEVI